MMTYVSNMLDCINMFYRFLHVLSCVKTKPVDPVYPVNQVNPVNSVPKLLERTYLPNNVYLDLHFGTLL